MVSSKHLILCVPPPLFCLQYFPAIALCIRWPKYLSFNFSNSPSNEYSELILFRIDWLGVLAVRRTLKSLLQRHSLKASILQHSAFLMVQLSYPYMNTGKIIALTMQIFVSKVMSLLFNTLSVYHSLLSKEAAS